jgi:hypothetical protein
MAKPYSVHVSASFMVNAIVHSDMSSGDTVADWLASV